MTTQASVQVTGKARSHNASEDARVAPSRWQYDYLVLSRLHRDIVAGLTMLDTRGSSRLALDVGAGGAPYRRLLEQSGYVVKSLDIAPGDDIDFVGSAEATGLPSKSVDLVLCTQVLEHTRTPWLAVREFARILRDGGNVLISVPHVWFHHPHPNDYWRMTSEGLRALCEDAGLEVRRLVAQGGSVAAFFQTVNFLAFGVLGRAGAPLYFASNALGGFLDRFVGDARFALNHLCVARKPALEAAQ
jgi:SAM-dependent methyltransferase